jgi:hypothetical protein
MGIPITLGLIYTLMLVLNFIKKDWPTIIKKYLLTGHIIFGALMVIDVVLLLTTNRTFRGIYFDRLIFWGLLITGGLFFALFKGKGLLTRIYFGTCLFYPIVAMGTFLIDRIMFVLIAGPILVSVTLPETYYKDNKFEIRNSVGLMAPRKMTLIEKNWLTEKQIGQTEYSLDGAVKIEEMEIRSITADSISARLDYEERSELVTFKNSR